MSEFKVPLARPHLSNRQRELIQLAAQGLADDEVAKTLGLSTQTVRTYWKQIRGKFGGANRTRVIAEVLTYDLASDQPLPADGHILYPHPIELGAANDFEAYKDQLALVLMALNVPLVIAWGLEGTVVFGNKAFEELLKRPISYVESVRDYGRWLGFWESGRQLAVHEWPVARVLRGEPNVEEDVYFLREDGRWVLARVQAIPIMKEGEIVGAIAAALKLREFAEPPWTPGNRGTE